ncbi:Septum-promoting GTP-binding protein 1 [Hordeum vulgare]|nr:Septum-promoting GTP-binding protein 1 [Hordeum vulgare]
MCQYHGMVVQHEHIVVERMVVKNAKMARCRSLANFLLASFKFLDEMQQDKVKYVGDGEEENGGLQMTGLNLMDKTLAVRGARLAFNIWDVAGDSKSADHVPIACKDVVAILFMFDLTSRCTLNKYL